MGMSCRPKTIFVFINYVSFQKNKMKFYVHFEFSGNWVRFKGAKSEEKFTKFKIAILRESKIEVPLKGAGSGLWIRIQIHNKIKGIQNTGLNQFKILKINFNDNFIFTINYLKLKVWKGVNIEWLNTPRWNQKKSGAKA